MSFDSEDVEKKKDDEIFSNEQLIEEKDAEQNNEDVWMDQREYKVPENWERQTKITRMWTTVFADENDTSSCSVTEIPIAKNKIKTADFIEEINLETVRGCWETPLSNFEGILNKFCNFSKKSFRKTTNFNKK